MDGKRIKGNEVYALEMCVSILLFAPIVVSQLIPTDKSQVEAWFNGIIKTVKERGKTLDPELVKAETEPRIIKVMQGGDGEFDTITKAIESVPLGNAKRVIISIGPGSYKEKIRIERNKPFITLLGDPKNMLNLTFDSTAKQYGTIDSATLTTESSDPITPRKKIGGDSIFVLKVYPVLQNKNGFDSYFVGANLSIMGFFYGGMLCIYNTALRPDGKMVRAQAVTLRVSGDRSAFYNCKIIGFPDTLCNDRGNHFFKDCHIHGTVDFIFGSGTSLYLHKREKVHQRTRDIRSCMAELLEQRRTYFWAGLGRAVRGLFILILKWTKSSIPVDSLVIANLNKLKYKCTGKGATPATRKKFVKQLSDAEAEPFLVLDYVEGTK
ncbi:hypothetical protein Gotur_032551 [Gossypium turneri]